MQTHPFSTKAVPAPVRSPIVEIIVVVENGVSEKISDVDGDVITWKLESNRFSVEKGW